VTGLTLVAYGFVLAAAWWTVVAVVAAIGRRFLRIRTGGSCSANVLVTK
jgi:hypothetical protein